MITTKLFIGLILQASATTQPCTRRHPATIKDHEREQSQFTHLMYHIFIILEATNCTYKGEYSCWEFHLNRSIFSLVALVLSNMLKCTRGLIKKSGDLKQTSCLLLVSFCAVIVLCHYNWTSNCIFRSVFQHTTALNSQNQYGVWNWHIRFYFEKWVRSFQTSLWSKLLTHIHGMSTGRMHKKVCFIIPGGYVLTQQVELYQRPPLSSSLLRILQAVACN